MGQKIVVKDEETLVTAVGKTSLKIIPTGAQGVPGPQGPQGPQGPAGSGDPEGPQLSLSNAAPKLLGITAPGTSNLASRDDHVHPMPSASDVGADPAGSAATVAGDLSAHEELTTAAHGGIVLTTDPRLSDARVPLAHVHSGSGDVEPGMTPPASPSPSDQEYWSMPDGAPVVGTWYNQGTATATISAGRLLMVCQAGASNYQQRAIIITRPDFASVTTRITVGGELTNHANAGLVLHNSGTGRILQWLVHLHGPGKDLELHRANSFTSFDSAITTTGVRVGVGHVYLRMTSDGTSIQRWVSGDGDRWIMVGSVTLASWIGSVTGAGIVVGQEHSGIAITASFDFLRFT